MRVSGSFRCALRRVLPELVTGVAALASSFVVFAQGLPDLPPPPAAKLPSPRTFADQQLRLLDKDGDKRISWQEFSAELRKAFDEMDSDRRGYLTHADLVRAYEKALVANGQPIPKDPP